MFTIDMLRQEFEYKVKDLGIDNNISMRTVRRYLHNCKDDFSRMRVQKFSTAGQQIAMTKTSISVTFDNLAVEYLPKVATVGRTSRLEK